MIFNQMHDRMNASVNRTFLTFSRAKIHFLRCFLIFCDMQCMFYQFRNTFSLCCRDWYNRYSEKCFQLIHTHRATVHTHLIHHIQRNNHWDLKFHKLHRQIHIPFNIGCIYNIDDSFRFILKQKFSCNNFLTAIRRHRINSRKIGNTGIGMFLDHTVFSVNRNTWEISHMLIRSGQLVEQRCFSTILISNQCKRKCRILR